MCEIAGNMGLCVQAERNIGASTVPRGDYMLTLEQVWGKSTANLRSIHPVLLAGTNVLIQRCYTKGIPIVITQGMRTFAEQNVLYAQGRSKPGTIITNARGGSSYHNYGLAVDFALLLPDGNAVSWDMKRDGDQDKKADWQEVVAEAKQLGFEWGGDWTTFQDYSHLQMTFGLTTDQLRAGKRPTVQQEKEALSRINGGDDEVDKDIKITITLNGLKLTEGVLDNDTTYAPLRILAEALGAKVTYDAGSKTVNITTK